MQEFNTQCMGCQESCKQFGFADVLGCKHYKPIVPKAKRTYKKKLKKLNDK